MEAREGDIVYFKSSQDSFPAMVTRVKDGGRVSLTIFTPSTIMHFQNVSFSSNKEEGCWYHREDLPKIKIEQAMTKANKKTRAAIENKRD